MSQPESRLVKRLRRYLEGEGARCFKIHGSDDSVQETGIPDLLCCWEGLFIAIEVKQPGAERDVSPRQRHVLNSIQRAGGIAEVVSSVEQVAMILGALQQRRAREGTRTRSRKRITVPPKQGRITKDT